MTPSIKSNAAIKLSLLQKTYKQQLPKKITNLESLWKSYSSDETNKSCLIDIDNVVRNLIDSGTTFGADAISNVARELESALKCLSDNKRIPSAPQTAHHKISELIERLKQAAKEWQPSDIPYIQPDRQTHYTGKLIYLVEEDEQLAKTIVIYLEQAGYRVDYVTELSELELSCKRETPAAAIIGSSKENNVSRIDIISRLRYETGYDLPVLIISENDDMESHLAASRIGASRYFCKPLDIQKLIYSLDGLTTQSPVTRYRVLLIDNETGFLETYVSILQKSGMIVERLSDYLDTLKVISEFKPDIVIMDVMMPECSGPELAQVIRQDDGLVMMPILFLSVISNFTTQLTAIELGADDFLVKPIVNRKLIASITNLVERSRKNIKLHKKLKMAIRENEFQLTTMNQHDIVSTTDVAGRITSINEKFCDISGYSRSELLGHNHRLLKSDYHPESFYEELWDTISKGNIWHGEICNIKKNGDEYWVDSTIVPFLNAKGKPYKYVSARTDITKLKQSQERLYLSQTFANIGTWDWNIRSGDLYWSSRISQLFGYKKDVDETTFEDFLSVIHPDDREMVVDAVNNCVDNGSTYNIEHRVVWPDNSVRWMQERGNVVRAEDGRPLHMLGVVQDITPRVLAEIALKESEEKYRLLFERSEDPMWMIIDNHFVLANQAAANILHYSSIEELINTHPSDISPEYQPNGKLSYDAANEMMAIAFRDNYHRFDWIHKKKNGEELSVEITLTHVPFEGKSALFCVGRDITERKLVVSALVKARKKAEKANLAKSQFLSSMSHELRTPMNAILGFSQLLIIENDPALTASQYENVNEILKAGNHLMYLINEILDLAKIESGKIDLSFEPVELNEIITESLQLITPLAKSRGIDITSLEKDSRITLEQPISDTHVIQADRTRLKQVLLNLLSNAVKYNSKNGKIIVSFRHADNNHIRISITDTGAGLDQEQKSNLFKPFNRLGLESSNIEGVGIGLVITKNIISLMNGVIGVDSQPGKGSTFWFELPIYSDANNHKYISSGLKPRTPESSETVDDNCTVLYIEDNPANLRLVSQILSQHKNIEMLSAHEPLLGIDIATEYKPELILLDINLPGMSGFDVLKKLRQKESTRNIPVIAISANAMPKDIEMGILAGFNDYITKPVVITELLLSVEKALQGSQRI